jgi:hypothetical protein
MAARYRKAAKMGSGAIGRRFGDLSRLLRCLAVRTIRQRGNPPERGLCDTLRGFIKAS